MRTGIATVCLAGTLREKMQACAVAGFDGIEIFEQDLVTSPLSPEEVRSAVEQASHLRDVALADRRGHGFAARRGVLDALVVGLDVKHLYALTFGLGAACVGAAGAMLVLVIDVTPPLGPALTLLAFVIVITGGLGSMPGALLGGVMIGLTEALAGLFFTPSAKSMFSFGLLVLVLLFRPQGILGKKAS